MTTEAEAQAATTTETPQPEPASNREQILKALADHDSVSSEEAPRSSENSQPPEELAAGEPKTDATETGSKPKPEEATLTERERKEQERKERSWQKLQEEKEAFKRERAELEAFREKSFKEIREARHKSQYSPDDYEAAAERFEADGREDLAEDARKTAAELRDEFAKERAEFERHRAEHEWQQNLQELAKDQPDLLVEGTDLHSTVKEVLEDKQFLQTYPGGIRDAVQAANLILENRQFKTVAQEKAELEARVKELEQKLQPGGASVSPMAPGSSFESLKPDQQREYLLNKFKEADASNPQLI